MGETVQAAFVVHSQGITNRGDELPDDLPDEEMEHIESTGALDDDGIQPSDTIDAAFGSDDGKEEQYLDEEPPEADEEEEPEQPPFEASEQQTEFYDQPVVDEKPRYGPGSGAIEVKTPAQRSAKSESKPAAAKKAPAKADEK